MRQRRLIATSVPTVLGVASCAKLVPVEPVSLTITASTTAITTTVGRPISFQPATASGGSQSYSYSISGLPAGLAVDQSTGVVSGSPTAPTPTRSLQITVTDTKQSGVTATTSFSSITVNDHPVVIPDPRYLNLQMTQGAAITPFTPLVATKRTPPFAYSAMGLPDGLNLTPSTGLISGTPVASNTNAVPATISATDAAGASTSANFTIRVNVPMVTTAPIIALSCTTNQLCNITPVATVGGTLPYSHVISPALPAGLTFATLTGAITGTPAATVAAATFRVVVTDAANATLSRDFQFSVRSPPLAPVPILTESCTQNTLCSFTPVTVSGGTAPLRYSSTPLPIGLSINSNSSLITGTPTATQAASNVTITITDANNATATGTFSLAVNPPLTTANGGTQKVCTQGSPCNAQIMTVTGGSLPYVFSVVPALPSGLDLNSATGQITGIATAASAMTQDTANVTDQNSAPATSRPLTLTINPTLTTKLSSPLYVCPVGVPCTVNPVTPVGGTPPFTYALIPANALPVGLTFNASTGIITGIPVTGQVLPPFTITVTDGATDVPRATSSQTFDLSTSCVVTVMPLHSIVTTTVGISFATVFPPPRTESTPVRAGCGMSPLTFQIAPALPAGLAFSVTNGQISGTPMNAASRSHTITISDAAGASASRTFALVINPSPIASVDIANQTCTQNASCIFTPVSGRLGTPPNVYTITPALPAGLTLNALSGSISGTATGLLQITAYTVRITDAVTATASATFLLSVTAPTLQSTRVEGSVIRGPTPTRCIVPACSRRKSVMMVGAWIGSTPTLPELMVRQSAASKRAGIFTMIAAPNYFR